MTGATFLTPYRREGNLIWPTLLDNVTPGMRIAWEEPFGPVLPIMRMATVAEAVAHCNASKFGLQVGWGRGKWRRWREERGGACMRVLARCGSKTLFVGAVVATEAEGTRGARVWWLIAAGADTCALQYRLVVTALPA